MGKPKDTMGDRLHVGGIVLCGGESSRMGLPKALLPFGPELMLQRVVRVLSDVVEPVVVVAAVGQQLPKLPRDIIVARDERECCGPLEGLRAGIGAIGKRANAVYAASCDVPLLSVAFIRYMISQLGEYAAAVPYDGEFYHPFAAIYRTDTVGALERLLGEGKMRTSDLFESVLTNRVPVRELRSSDPELLSLLNVNTPRDYARALELAGIPINASLKTQLGL
ncbi:MAG TPA: molybdenum cofactor guanylyltransferase [Pirellulaceae bacterium]|nr:molybdenum cofactor guanylyltransferase [Pirellulaceae bacterium]